MYFVNGHQVFDFSVDCVCAWVAHQFGPYLPDARFFRRHFSWLPLILLVFPTQFVVYESYVISRPWYAYFAIYSLAIGAGIWWICFETYRMKFESNIQPGVFLHRFPGFRQKMWAFLIGLPVLYAAFTLLWLYLQRQPSTSNLIVVARFSGPNPEMYSPTHEILRSLHQVANSTEGFNILPARMSLTEEDGPTAAIRLGTALVGTRNDASLVLWGWYTLSSNHAIVTANIEVLGKEISLPGYSIEKPQGRSGMFNLREIRYLVPIDRLNSFKLQADVAEELRARSFYILSFVWLARKDYGKAEKYLDEANSGPDQEFRELELPRPNKGEKAEHAKNGPLTDFLQAAAEASSRAKISGKWRVLVARAYARLALNRANEAMLDCAEAALLSPSEPVPYFCLGHVHLRIAETEPKFAVRSIQLERAREDCSVAIQIDPKFAGPHGCRAEANLMLASLSEPEVHPAIGELSSIIGALSGRSVPTAAYGGLKEAYLFESLNDWSEVIRVDPTNSHAFESRGTVLKSLGEYTKAEADYTRAIGLYSKSVSAYTAYNGRGLLRLQAGNAASEATKDFGDTVASHAGALLWEQSLNDFESAVRISPREAVAWCNLGEAAKLLQRVERARESLQKCRDFASDAALRTWATEKLRSLN